MYLSMYISVDYITIQIVIFWPRKTFLTSKFIYIKFPDDLNMFGGHRQDTYIQIYTQIHTYTYTLFSMVQNHVKSPIIGLKRRFLHQNSCKLNFQTIRIGLNMMRCTDKDTYIDINIHTHILYCLFCNIENNVCIYIYIYVFTSWGLQT